MLPEALTTQTVREASDRIEDEALNEALDRHLEALVEELANLYLLTPEQTEELEERLCCRFELLPPRNEEGEDDEAPRPSERFEADDPAAPRVLLESCDLELTCTFSGENTTVEGTLNGYRIKAKGSASGRGTQVVIDGVERWWCGDYSDPLEALIEDLFDRACVALVAEYGDQATDQDWRARIVDGEVVDLDMLDSEDEGE
jgi:hypothetical protein